MSMKKRTLAITYGIGLGVLFCSTAWAADDPNQFNRIFKPPGKNIDSLKNDGIHDKENPGLSMLQEPKDAFKPLVKGRSGNAVDWVKSQDKKKFTPKYNHLDESEQALPMDLHIEMQVKGTMPDVSFPHKTHTQLLECANCHTDIFIPKKGANPMSMAEIMLGQKCGVCHGSVAFPVTECRRCHSVNKKAVKKSTKKPNKKR
ncbi:MAG: multiheme c-type cytochrome [Gammaproteobacteria bacterium]|nr:multiheme c-type cytochrome [Gammaproteobacteria bacterium]MDH5802307.1 multiheme c-type cytochrome [Gammaproteobacteria bacterium]